MNMNIPNEASCFHPPILPESFHSIFEWQNTFCGFSIIKTVSQLFLLLLWVKIAWQWLIFLFQSELRTWVKNVTGWERRGDLSSPNFRRGFWDFVPCLIYVYADSPVEKHEGDYTNTAQSLTCHLFSKLCLKVKCHFLDFLPCYTACFNVPSKQRKQLFPHQAYISYREKKEKQIIIMCFGKGKEPGCVPRRQISIISTPIIYFRNVWLP